ncbi:MAG: M23 family metallopeptidase [Kineosporiaceae bacterium]
MKPLLGVLAVVPTVLVGALLALVVLLAPIPAALGDCTGIAGVRAGPLGSTTAPVAGYAGEQLANAALIIDTGHALGVPLHGQTIAVMTAMGESGLRVLDRGDAVGPDSRGLFQQRANGAWGSYQDRMDPQTSATSFYRALLRVDGWQDLPPTLAAHRVQRNADPEHYERWWQPAQEVVTALTGAPPACEPAAPGDVAASGWTRPSTGPVTSGFGYRTHPVTGERRLHRGIDFGAPCGDPVRAAAAGVVVRAGPAAGYGYVVLVDHGRDEFGRTVVTAYAHMFADGILVRVGDPVAAGQQIAEVGTSGTSTGCHLHVEVRQDGTAVDPAPYLAARGVVV